VNGYLLAILFVADSFLGIWSLVTVIYLEWLAVTPSSAEQVKSYQFQEMCWTLVCVASFVGMLFLIRSTWKLFMKDDR
jgi:hypothetical protein